jgi:alanyl-tRNA synthetase
VKNGIMPVKDMYIILDHCRTAMMIIQDGSLPSNLGGGSNVRNIIRRVFAILKKNGWWEKVGGIDGFLELFEHERADLKELFGEFPAYKSFNDIIKMEYTRWMSTDLAMK